MLGEIIAIANAAFDLYGKVSSVTRGNKTEKLLDQIDSRIERLSEHILYAPSMDRVRDITRNRQRYVDDMRSVREGLEPVQRALSDDILSSAMIWTPEKTRQSMEKNPWKLLDHIQPLGLATPPSDPNLMPVTFEYQGVQYIGWQKEGAIPILFDLSYTTKESTIRTQFRDRAHENKVVRKRTKSIITLRYTDNYEWVRLETNGNVTVGIVDNAQEAMGDVVYIELPETGLKFNSGKACAIVESVKAASDIFAPLSGVITAVNDRLIDSPELVNVDPYGAGWLFRMKPHDPGAFGKLLKVEPKLDLNTL